MHKTIEFFAGKKSGRPKKVKFTKTNDPFHIHNGKISHGFPVGLAEKGGFDFDKTFGLGKANLFEADIGIDPNFGLGGMASYDAVESNSFMNADFENHPSAIDPVDDINIEDQYIESAGYDNAPTLLGSVKKIDRRIPLTDEDEDSHSEFITNHDAFDKTLTHDQKLERKFRKIRAEAMASGGNPLSAEEEVGFNYRKSQGNLGTTSKKSVPYGRGFY